MALKGEPISPGLALGQAYLLKPINLDALEKNRFPVNDTVHEIERLDQAIEKTMTQLQRLLAQADESLHREVGGIFQVQVALLEDSNFLDRIKTRIRKEAVNTEHVIATEIQKTEATFKRLKDEVMRSRFLDIQDVHHRLLRNLLDIEHVRTNPFKRLAEPVVLVADSLLPSDIALLELSKILGIVIEEGSKVSHVAIIAKSLGIPALTKVVGSMTVIRSGDSVMVDAHEGIVLVNPDPHDLDRYEHTRKHHEAHALSSRGIPSEFPPCRTTDGVDVTLEANAGSLREVEDALAAGADGVGLLRTEFFYMACPKLPTVAEESAFYRHVVRAMRPRPVTIRLLDLGADKTVSYLKLPEEANPQLGVRGVRLLNRSPELLRHHLVSVLRASATGPIRVLLPFVATLADLDRVLGVLDELCHAEHITREHIRVGIMVEVPSVALGVKPFLDRVDFLSIGTNDLMQYVFAASREDSDLDEYRQSHHPTILRLVHSIAAVARSNRKPVSVCGELASDPLIAPLLVGLGVRALSMQTAALAAVRDSIRRHSARELGELAHRALRANRTEDISELLRTGLTNPLPASY